MDTIIANVFSTKWGRTPNLDFYCTAMREISSNFDVLFSFPNASDQFDKHNPNANHFGLLGSRDAKPRE